MDDMRYNKPKQYGRTFIMFVIEKVLRVSIPLPASENDGYSQPSIGMTADHQQQALPQPESQKMNKHHNWKKKQQIW
jgi:hypothetical protein